MHDLLDECGKDLKNFGYITEELGRYKVTCSKLFIHTEEKAKKLGFDKGHYFILNAPLLLGLKEEHYKFLKTEIKSRVKFLLKENKIKVKENILFVNITCVCHTKCLFLTFFNCCFFSRKFLGERFSLSFFFS